MFTCWFSNCYFEWLPWSFDILFLSSPSLVPTFSLNACFSFMRHEHGFNQGKNQVRDCLIFPLHTFRYILKLFVILLIRIISPSEPFNKLKSTYSIFPKHGFSNILPSLFEVITGALLLLVGFQSLNVLITVERRHFCACHFN